MIDYIKLHREYITNGSFSKLILDSAAESVFTKTPEGIITLWNKGAEKIFGYSANEIIGKSESLLIPQEKSGEQSDILKKTNQGEKVLRLKTQRITKSGILIEVIISIIPIYDEEKIIGATVFQSDLSTQYEIERKYYELFEQAADAILISDINGRFTEVNDAATKMLGYSKDELLSKTVLDLIPPKDSERLRQSRELLLKQGGTQITEGKLKNKEGNYLPVEIRSRILKDGRWQALIRDLSKQKESETKYYELFEQASDAIFIADLNGRYTEVNSAATKMLGYTKEELIGKTILDIIPPEDAERLKQSKENLMKPGEIHIGEWKLKKKDGNYLPTEVSTSILKSGRWQAFVRDLSLQKETERKFGLIFESSPDAQLIISQDGTIQMVNDQCIDMLGYQKNELVGQKIEILVPEEHRGKHPAQREKFVSENKRRRMHSGQLKARKKDGSEIPVDIALSPMQLDKETIVLASVRDLSELKELANYTRNLLEASPDPFIVSNLDGIITDANKAASDTFGFEIGKLDKIILSSFFTDPKGLEEYISKVKKKERVKEIPLTAKDSKGNLIDFLVSASVYNDFSGKSEGVCYVLKDISELIKVASKMISEAAKT